MAKMVQSRINALSTGWNIVFNLLLIGMVAMCVIPVLLVYSVSFSSEASIADHGYRLIPKEFSLFAYDFMFKTGDHILNAYMISIIVTVCGTILALMITAMFAYVISRKSFKMRNVFAFIAYFTMLFSGGLIPSYMINTQIFSLNNNILALILPYLVSAWNVLVLRTFFQTAVPDSIIESAKIDGAGEFTTFFRIVMPLAKPGLATIGFMLLIMYWNDWWLAMLYIKKQNLVPIQQLLMKAINSIEFIRTNSRFLATPQGQALLNRLPSQSGRMALVVIATTPILFAYPFFQKYFIKGLTIGGVKG